MIYAHKEAESQMNNFFRYSLSTTSKYVKYFGIDAKQIPYVICLLLLESF